MTIDFSKTLCIIHFIDFELSVIEQQLAKDFKVTTKSSCRLFTNKVNNKRQLLLVVSEVGTKSSCCLFTKQVNSR